MWIVLKCGHPSFKATCPWFTLIEPFVLVKDSKECTVARKAGAGLQQSGHFSVSISTGRGEGSPATLRPLNDHLGLLPCLSSCSRHRVCSGHWQCMQAPLPLQPSDAQQMSVQECGKVPMSAAPCKPGAQAVGEAAATCGSQLVRWAALDRRPCRHGRGRAQVSEVVV